MKIKFTLVKKLKMTSIAKNKDILKKTKNVVLMLIRRNFALSMQFQQIYACNNLLFLANCSESYYIITLTKENKKDKKNNK